MCNNNTAYGCTLVHGLTNSGGGGGGGGGPLRPPSACNPDSHKTSQGLVHGHRVIVFLLPYISTVDRGLLHGCAAFLMGLCPKMSETSGKIISMK